MTLFVYLTIAIYFADVQKPPEHHRVNTFNTDIDCRDSRKHYVHILKHMKIKDTVDKIKVYCVTIEEPYSKT